MLDSHERLRSTLAHEMCHAAQWVLDGASKVLTLALTLTLTLTLTLHQAAAPKPNPNCNPTPEQPPHGPHFRRWADRFERAVPGMLWLGLELVCG